MSTSINDPELGEILYVNNIASISEKATVADYEALRKAYDLVNDLQLKLSISSLSSMSPTVEASIWAGFCRKPRNNYVSKVSSISKIMPFTRSDRLALR